MSRETRGWTGADRAKPAEEVDIRYGHGLLKRESSAWPGYVLVSTPSAHRAAGRYLGREPEAVGYVDLLDWGQLKALAEGLDVESAELVIGLGAGRALDASKYVALANDLPLVLVPSVVSTGAIIHALVAKWDGRRILGGTADWAWVECDHVLVDYDLALEAPYYLNTGGLGDCLSGYSGVAEWRHNARNGVGPPVEDETVGRVLEGFDAMADEFPRTLDRQGRLTADSIHYISVALQERDGKGLRHPAAPAADHPFLQAIELVNDMGWVHGRACRVGVHHRRLAVRREPRDSHGLAGQVQGAKEPRRDGRRPRRAAEGAPVLPGILQRRGVGIGPRFDNAARPRHGREVRAPLGVPQPGSSVNRSSARYAESGRIATWPGVPTSY